MRVIDPAGLAALATGRFGVRNLVLFELGSGPWGCWDDVYAITLAAQVYQPQAGRFQMSPIGSVSDMSVQGVEVTFSGVDPAVLAVAQDEEWHQRPATCTLAILEAGTTTILATKTWFRGIIDAARWREKPGSPATITVSLESLSRELDRRGAATRTDADHRRRLASDGFFRHTANAVATEVYWGRLPPRKHHGHKNNDLPNANHLLGRHTP